MKYREYLKNVYLPLKVKSVLGQKHLNDTQIQRIVDAIDLSEFPEEDFDNCSALANGIHRYALERLIEKTARVLADSDYYEYFLINLRVLVLNKDLTDTGEVILRINDKGKLSVMVDGVEKISTARKLEFQARLHQKVPDFKIGWEAMDVLMILNPKIILYDFTDHEEYIEELKKVFGDRVKAYERVEEPKSSKPTRRKTKEVEAEQP